MWHSEILFSLGYHHCKTSTVLGIFKGSANPYSYLCRVYPYLVGEHTTDKLQISFLADKGTTTARIYIRTRSSHLENIGIWGLWGSTIIFGVGARQL